MTKCYGLKQFTKNETALNGDTKTQVFQYRGTQIMFLMRIQPALIQHFCEVGESFDLLPTSSQVSFLSFKPALTNYTWYFQIQL